MQPVVALFGEAEKGNFQTPHFCRTLLQLVETLGEPPEATDGLFCAVQAILYEHTIIYFRVQEEGFSTQDYFWGLHYLSRQDPPQLPALHALCLPGVGNAAILQAIAPVQARYHSILLMTQRDLYDYLTA